MKNINPKLVRTIELFDVSKSKIWKVVVKKNEYRKLFGIINLYKSDKTYYSNDEECLCEDDLLNKYSNLFVNDNGDLCVKPYIKFTFLNGSYDYLCFNSYDDALNYFNNFFK